MTSKKMTPFEAAEQLFEISKALIETDETLSQLTLFVADRVLKLVEQPGPVICPEPIEPDKPIFFPGPVDQPLQGVFPCSNCGTMTHPGMDCPGCGMKPGMEKCPDCGGMKPIGEECRPGIPDGMEPCPDCGGLKPIGSECEVPSFSQTPNLQVVDTTGDGNLNEEIDPEQQCHGHVNNPENMCHGHMADGSGIDPNYVSQQNPGGPVPPPTAEEQNEVKSMVEKIRNELKGK